MVVVLKGSGTAFKGTARLTVKNKYGETHSTGNQNITLSANGTTFFGMPYLVKWGSTGTTLVNPNEQQQVRKQALRYTLAFQREGEATSSPQQEQTLNVECTLPSVSPVTPKGPTQYQTSGSSPSPKQVTPKPILAKPVLKKDLKLKAE